MPFWDLNCLYIPQYHFHPLHYTVHSPLFLLEIVDVDRWEEYKMPVGRGGGVIMRHVELDDRHLRSHGKIKDCEQSMTWAILVSIEIKRKERLQTFA